MKICKSVSFGKSRMALGLNACGMRANACSEQLLKPELGLAIKLLSVKHPELCLEKLLLVLKMIKNGSCNMFRD